MQTRINRSKPYKARPPRETVSRIKAILEEIGFTLIEKPVTGHSCFKASTLSIINPENNQIIFSTYGKGRSSEWASASAWGEMIERIQNLAFYMALIYPSQPESSGTQNADFGYFPDEKSFILNTETLNGELLRTMPIENKEHRRVIGIPFKNIYSGKLEYIPFRTLQVMVGSNGMCSGNTMEEALIQGISEVYERYLLKIIYSTPICPPDIPLSCFEETEIGKEIQRLIREEGLSIRIKDCSMQRSFPVIGVLIQNSQHDYTFHLGADPCPITALERCFTEMFQGGNICFQSMDQLKANLPYDLNADFWRKNLDLTIKAYAGQWPPEILSDNPTYEFRGFNHPESVSDSDDLNYLLQLLKKEDKKVYIRDNSFLGHPAYYVYIPGMSEISNQPDSTFSATYLEFDNFLKVLTNLKNSSVQQRTEMLNVVYRYIDKSPIKKFLASEYFRYYPSHPIAGLESDQLLTLIEMSLLEGEISDHFDEQEIKSNPFLNALNANDNSCRLSDLFNKLYVPECFYCRDCSQKKKCNYPFIISAWERVKEKMSTNPINQINVLNFADA